MGTLGAVDGCRYGNDKYGAVADSVERSAVAQPPCTNQLSCIDLQRTVVAGAQGLDAFGSDIETYRVVVLAELHCQRQADVAQADDGDPGSFERGHSQLPRRAKR